MKKKQLFCILLAIGWVGSVWAQGIVIHHADGSISAFQLDDVESINAWGIENVDGKLFVPDERVIVQTIDARIVNPGVAAPYIRADLQPYTPPRFIRRSTDIGVSPRLLNRHLTHPNSTELW